MQGVSPGAALVFLLCGPATNLGSIGVLNREFGRRTIVLYLAAIVLIALAMGGLLNLLAGDLGVNLGARALDEPLVPMPLKTLGAILFLAMAVFTARRRRYVERCAAWLDARFPGLVTVRRAKAAVAALLVAAYLASGFYVVSPGEAGIVRTFGAVSRSEVPPGLHFAWPYPVGRVDRVPVGRVERMLFGYRLAPDGTPTWQVDEDESWTLVGDENIADIRMALHFGVVAEELLSYQFAVSDRERLVRSAALAAVREVLGGASINQVLTTERRRYEREIEARIAERLDAYGTGIRVHSFHILDAHAPAQVHGAFRDIASALEDRDTEINRARAEEAKIVPLARGEAAGRRAEAEGHASRVVAQARGESDRFLALSRVHEKWPRVTQKRLEYETLEELFPKIRKYLKPADGDGGGLEIWFVDPSAVKEAPETLLQKP
jgi:membrane protease subunit HflK